MPAPIPLPATVMHFSPTDFQIEYLVRVGDRYEWQRNGDPHVFETEMEIVAAKALHGGMIVGLERPPEPPAGAVRRVRPVAEGRRDWMSKWEQEHEG
jgi:hypothetical protein